MESNLEDLNRSYITKLTEEKGKVRWMKTASCVEWGIGYKLFQVHKVDVGAFYG